VLKNFGVYAGFNFISLIIGFLTIPILTRLIDPEQYGVLGVAISFSVFLFPLLSICSESYVQVKYTEFETHEEYKHFLSINFLLITFISLITLIVTAVVVQVYAYNAIYILIPALVWIQVLRRILMASFVVEGKKILFGKTNVIYSVLSFILSLYFLYFISASALYRLLGIALSEAIIFTVLAYPLIRLSFDFVLFRNIIGYGLPLILTSIPAWFLNEFGRQYLNYNGSLDDVAMITISLQFSMIYLQLNKAILNSVLKEILDKNNYAFSESIKLTFFQSGILILVLLNIYYFYDILIGSKYAQAKNITLIFVVAFYFQSLSLLPSTYLNKFRKNYIRLLVVIICAVINITCVSLFYPKYGIIIIPLSSVLSFVIYSFLLFFVVGHLNRQLEFHR